jgi:hypothetical protein
VLAIFCLRDSIGVGNEDIIVIQTVRTSFVLSSFVQASEFIAPTHLPAL